MAQNAQHVPARCVLPDPAIDPLALMSADIAMMGDDSDNIEWMYQRFHDPQAFGPPGPFDDEVEPTE